MKKWFAFIFAFLFPLAFFAAREADSGVTLLHDGAIGVDYQNQKYYEFDGEFFRIELFAKTGTFNIFCKPNDGKECALLSTVDFFSSSNFLMKLDGTVYNLCNSSFVQREVRSLENGAQLVFQFVNELRLVVDFSYIASREDEAEDIIQVKLYTINLGTKTHRVDLKAIFDTVCGENTSIHFTTDRNKKIRNETSFSASEIENERAFLSSNEKVSFQFVLDGANVSPVEKVTIANINRLHKMEWEALIRKGRGFSDIHGYDDSGIMIDWPDFSLAPDEKTEFTFYISAAENGSSPRGLAYIDGLLTHSQEKKDDEPIPALPPKKENSDKRTDVDFIVPPIKDYQLDPEYIQGLIDRIDALQSSKDVNKNELKKLNAELDAILDKLRRQ
ncbi:MAG: hypothetical protein IJ158_10830 [Treponema sp.]|nr:hypothetical protein [Treponema sp.]